MKIEGQIRIPSGCAISAMISKDGRKMNGEKIIKSMIPMHDRSNGLGGGFAAYGIYPKYKDFYAFHIFLNGKSVKEECEKLLKDRFEVVKAEVIPIHKIPEITDVPLIYRYFVTPLHSVLERLQMDENEYVARSVMYINTYLDGAYVFSSGKNMGTFKAVGFPEDVGRFYKLDEYELELSVPIMFSAMSYGSISYNAHKSLATAAKKMGIYYNTGEDGLHEDFYCYGENTIVQVASGRFGVHEKYLNTGAAIEIKMGQGAKPGIGGHLPGAKIVGDVSRTRMIPEGSDAISPAPHHDIYSIEDLRQLVYSLKEATEYKKPIIVKVAAVHNIAAIASGIARSGADMIAIDGFRGGTGAAPTRIRDNVGIPIELALVAVDTRLREEGIRNNVSLVVGGSIRSAADVVKAIALGADACYIATAAVLALGCHLCRTCQTGKCNWGIATQRPELVKRLNPEIGAECLVNLVTAWKHEIKELMGGMGINSIEALKGNRLMLRGVGLTGKELEILGISHAGE